MKRFELNRRETTGMLGLLALSLFAAPLLFGFSADGVSTGKAAVLGAAFALLAFAAYVELSAWAARGAALAGAAAAGLSFVPGMHETPAAFWTHLGVGALGLLVALGGRRHFGFDEASSPAG